MEASDTENKKNGFEDGQCDSVDPKYLRGFHDAERRRETVNVADELPFSTAVLHYTVAMTPVAILWIGTLWLTARMKRGAGLRSSSNNQNSRESFQSELKKVFQNAMTPLAPRDFRVHVKGTRFRDVIGTPESVHQVQQYVDFLQSPQKFTRLGARLPKGCLLTGPPGTGKTLLAKAVAGEADVPFFSCNGADFMELYAGSGPKRVRELFAAAKSAAPSVVFIDELDAVGARNGQGGGTSIDAEENRTINQLLAELDGLSTADSVVVFAATNFKDNIDKALLRDGRFDRKVELQLPDKVGREEIFTHYLKKIKLAEEAGKADNSESKKTVSIAAKLAGLTPGVSPATISTIVNEAAVQAAVAGHDVVPLEFLFPAIDDVLLGKKQSTRSRASETASIRTAWHESGHALVAWLLSPLQSDVIKISIIPRNLHHDKGGGGVVAGYTQQVGREALDMKTELSLFSDVCVMMGGRYGEMLMHKIMNQKKQSITKGEPISDSDMLYQHVSTGAQDDFQRATQLALENFLSFGMAPAVPTLAAASGTHLGLLSYEPQRIREGRMYQKHSKELQSLAEEEAGRFIESAGKFVQQLLEVHADALEKLALALLERKELLRDDLIKILSDVNPAGLSTEEQDTSKENRNDKARRIAAARAAARKALDIFVQSSEEAALKRSTSRDALASSN